MVAEQDRQKHLIQRAQAGDRDAFEEMFVAHRERLRSFVDTRIGQGLRRGLETEDVLQDTFMKTLQLIDRFQWRGPDSFFRWLAAIAEHIVLNAAKKHRRAPAGLGAQANAEARSASPSRLMRRNERFERLSAALDRLSATQRRAILLTRIEGRRVEEVAEDMNKTPEAIKKTITRALKRLRKDIGETGSFHLPDRLLGEPRVE